MDWLSLPPEQYSLCTTYQDLQHSLVDMEKFDSTQKSTGQLGFAVFWTQGFTHTKQVSPKIIILRTIPNPKKGYSYGPAIVFLGGQVKPSPYRIIHTEVK